jgi:hypothetical protein
MTSNCAGAGHAMNHEAAGRFIPIHKRLLPVSSGQPLRNVLHREACNKLKF